jgi:hypothetical protein
MRFLSCASCGLLFFAERISATVGMSMQICCFFSESEKTVLKMNFWQFPNLQLLATVMLLGWMDVVSSYLARSSATLVRDRLIHRDKNGGCTLTRDGADRADIWPSSRRVLDRRGGKQSFCDCLLHQILPDLSSSPNLFGFFPSAPEYLLKILKPFRTYCMSHTV